MCRYVECTRMCSTVVVACVSPVAGDAAHTVNTLQYAVGAVQVEST